MHLEVRATSTVERLDREATGRNFFDRYLHPVAVEERLKLIWSLYKFFDEFISAERHAFSNINFTRQ